MPFKCLQHIPVHSPLGSNLLALLFWSLLSVKPVISHVYLRMNVLLTGSHMFTALQFMKVICLCIRILLGLHGNLMRLPVSDIML